MELLLLFPIMAFGYLNIPRNCITQNRNATKMEGMLNMTLESNKWRAEGLEMHNKFRQLHGSPPLVLNEDLCKSATWVAENYQEEKLDRQSLLLTPEGRTSESQMSPCAENVWISRLVDWQNKSIIPAQVPVTAWYVEVVNYTYEMSLEKPANLNDVRHFTAMIWKGTKEMCMGYAKSTFGGLTYVVAHYFPPGNIESEFYANVRASPAGLGSDHKSTSGRSIPSSFEMLKLFSSIFFVLFAIVILS